MTGTSPEIKPAAKQLIQNRRHEAKLNRLRKKAIDLGEHIRQHFYQDYGITLPEYRMVYNESKPIVYECNTITGEVHSSEVEKRLDNLAKLYYTLTGTQYSLGGMFISPNGTIQTQTICHTYTRNRIDPVWNSKKSQLIRQIYYHYIQDGIESGELADKTPIHLTLTVPHKDGTYKGQRFYGKVLVNDFNKLRKNNAFWYGAVYGGEYGVETTQSAKGNGLHIHTHSFSLLNKYFNPEAIPARGQFKVQLADLIREFERGDNTNVDGGLWGSEFNDYDSWKVTELKKHLVKLCKENPREVRLAWFQDKMYHAWYKLTEAKQIWVEHLYTFERDKEGKKVYEYKHKDGGLYYENEATAEYYKNTRGEEYIKYPKKKNVDISNPNEYTAGIMECIKYHFKGDAFENKEGDFWDCELIADTLNETRGMRLYSRFGAFYKKSELSFNKKCADNGKEDIEPVGGDIKNIIGKMVNPHTQQYAAVGQTILAVFKPEQRTYFNTDVDVWKEKQRGMLPGEGGQNDERKNLSYERNSSIFVAVDENLPIKYVIKEMVLKRTGYLQENRFNTEFQAWYKIIAQLWAHVRTEQNDYNKWIGTLPKWQKNYDKRDGIGKLKLIVDTMQGYLTARMRITSSVALNDDGNPLLIELRPLDIQLVA